ncbi:metal ABC transporter substrate-binding protein [Ruminococcus sp.]|uniref:metal ABC transporter substrate-binding protein n=1 Tax=Ruminococcus sp. TaxID=41978 RepID=UPI002614BE8B|nr:metal ABC transporter substrate-binding protein [Ruminococcus sp.]MDD6988850.1 metal ABC transporter substrate-binding protein [Ruminococcus sp.]MDY6202656.1 metal ABC transporter substrate-binding protein [Ruminococcus sp.]
MKKFLSFALSLFIVFTTLFTLSSCSYAKSESKNDSGKVSVVTTIFPYYDFTRSIAGDKADIKLLLSPGSEPHSYEPSPSDIVAIENCDIFIYNGGESDEWVESVLDSIENKNMKVMRMMDYVDLLYEQSVDHDEHEHEDGDEHEHEHGEEYDEHIWTSVKNAEKLTNAIYDELCVSDSANKAAYSSNRDSYLSKLQALDSEISDIVSNSKRNTVVFGDRFPFLYFVTDYSLEYECAFPGCSSETEPSISTVTHMIDFTRENKISVVFYLEFSNGKVAKLISEDTGAKTMRFSSCHNVTKDEFADGATYISLMEQNANALKEALN